jgi:hypothetical protein
LERTPQAEEAILLASEPRDVREYLAKRAKDASFFSDPISKETEADLLARSNRLIDLSLAEYSLHREIALALFERDPEDWPIRSLVLSNEALSKASLRGFPECLFGSEEALIEFLRTMSPSEQVVLFKNPSLDDHFLESFLSMGKPWEAVDPEHRVLSLHSLASNKKLHRERSTEDHFDGWAWYMAGKPFSAAWLLIAKLEPDPKAARHLGTLLRDLPGNAHGTEEIAEGLGRWKTPLADAEKEAEDNAKGWLSDYQTVRQAGARHLASRHDAEPGRFLDSDDVALRCGAYQGERKLDEGAVKAAVQRDGDLARVHLIRNEHLWRREKTRDLLRDEVLRGAEGDEPRWEFRWREARYRKEFPGWFKDEDEGYTEPDERPIAESSIADVVAGVTSDPAVKGLQERLAALEKTQQTIFWMVGITLIILVAQAWW